MTNSEKDIKINTNYKYGLSKEQDEVDIPPETNEMPEAGTDVAENVISDADAMAKEITE